MKTINLPFAKKIALLTAITIMVACSWLATFESAANSYIDSGLKRALISFATARTLNAALSVAEGTDVSIQPMGIGVKFSLGQVLKPVNEVVEQFAQLMLVASIAFGIQKILISIGAHWMISLCLTGIAVGWGFLYFRGTSPPVWLTRILIVMLMARFAVPVAVIGSDAIFHEFMAADYVQSQKTIEVSSDQIGSLTSSPTDQTSRPSAASPDKAGLWSKAKEFASGRANPQPAPNPPATPGSTDSPAEKPASKPASANEESGFWSTVTGARKEVTTRLANLKDAAENLTERVLKLMAIFVLQTIILPLLMVWGLWAVTKGSFDMRPATAPASADTKAAQLG